ncbi:MAG: hypothetical protein Q9186_000123 [Xanthomendoza sp. 1 TL-2023]
MAVILESAPTGLRSSVIETSNHVTVTKQQYVQEPVAVVGMACRLPGDSNSPAALWHFLERGGSADNEAPPTRFNLKNHHDGSKKPKTMRSPGGMFLENINPRVFDAQFFGISRTDAIAMDPQQRQLLEVVYECLENAGLRMEELDGAKFGCFVGSYAVDYADIQARDPDDRAPSITVGVGRAILSNRISHFLNIKGPSMTIDTACSGSLVSVDVACRYLQSGEIDGAIVGAANLYLSPEHNMDGGAMKGASSLSGRCHTFDVKADGYIKAEGVNAVILKRLSDAIRDGDPIRSIIRGSATNSDGRTPGIASPSSEAQATAIRAAYANAGITDLSGTTYLECHGTGTQAGDPTEVGGVASVFSGSRTFDDPLIIGSVKSNIGHSEPAAGISGLLKTILSIENGIIPGTPTFVTPNPKIDFQTLKVRASRTALPWPKTDVRRASVNSFGYGGSNAHVVLEEPKVLVGSAKPTFVSSLSQVSEDFFGDDEPKSTRPFTLVFSANDESSLQAYTKKIRQYLMNPSVKVSLPDLAYTLSERRTHHYNRGYVVAQSTTLNESAFVFQKKSTEPLRVGFVFTGQGAQWSRMGKSLVDNFPTASLLLRHLDDVLQSTPNPPSWSLLKELVEPRSPEVLRSPEFSQPLVTALQLVLMSILEDWGVTPQAVVGHSSGELAAACAAGYLSKEDALKAAFYRGQAAKNSKAETVPVGMLAVGLGPDAVAKYIEGSANTVQIACFNSPNSVTLSGALSSLEDVKSHLVEDGHFARMLQVNLAYHSRYMTEIGADYETLLEADFEHLSDKRGNVAMYSSVFGREMEGSAHAHYWKTNMVSPVMFDQAASAMVSGKEGANFLIEIGPSNALAGPVKQILTALGSQGSNVQYCTALSRGQDSIKSTYDVAGRLFASGGVINLAKVNTDMDGAQEVTPNVIVDLPNYSWNKSNEYWYESESSKDWRNRMFGHHDLLGSKVLATSWHTPAWKKTLRVADLPWLKDHKMGPEIVFPAAGFMAMAVEAIHQSNEALTQLEGKQPIDCPRYRLRDCTFNKALVLEEGEEHKIMLTLTPVPGGKSDWHEFVVSSLIEDAWKENSRGLVRVEEEVESKASEATLKPLANTTPGQMWYKAMNDAGYNFGPKFQKQLEVDSISGERTSRSLVSFTEPESEYPQSHYPIHPAVIDGCLQTSAPSLWKGNRSAVNAVLVPAIIDEVIITSRDHPETAISDTNSQYVGLGRREETKSYMSNASVYDARDGSLLFRLSGLRYHKLDTQEDPYAAHNYSRVTWKPDITYLSQEALDAMTKKASSEKNHIWKTTNELIDLVAHKKPNVKVMEVNMIRDDSSSAWLDGNVSDKSTRAACTHFHYTSVDPSALITAQEEHEGKGNTEFSLLDITKPTADLPQTEDGFDLIIVRLNTLEADSLQTIVQHAKNLLSDGGRVLFLEHSASDDDFVSVQSQSQVDMVKISATILEENGFHNTQHVPCEPSNGIRSVTISTVKLEVTKASSSNKVNLIRFSDSTPVTKKIANDLQDLGWDLTEHNGSFESFNPKSTVLVMDDLSSALLPTIREDQWDGIKALTQLGARILWVTEGSQLDVTHPERAMAHGLFRTVRAEDPSVSVTTLDVESASGPATLGAIDNILKSLRQPAPKTHIENEFVERNGVISVCRILPDHRVNHAEKEDRSGADLQTRNIHEAETTIRMQCERLGTIDSLCYTEVDSQELPLPDGCVEVEIAAAGLNFKDIAITMGIIPENQHLLGLEGAGTIRRVGKSATQFTIGQRVLVFEKGTFGNRIIATTERTYAIPDTMTFEEASTLPSVYLTAIYSLFDLANTQKGHVFATVGNDKKRTFLMEKFGIPPANIFNSRSTTFATELMRATKGYGVDVILNSLTGDLLDESWRCIANGGVMVELGKKDMLDRNYLSMEPFGRNASFRCFDMSHKHVSDALIARLLDQLMGLIEKGHVKPIDPIKTFSFEDIPSAFRFMRGANHIGKIVISNAAQKAIEVPVRPAARKLPLRGDVSYLIIGGLKGLCGSLAVYIARHGAKHIVVMSRSGYEDNASKRVLNDLYNEGCQVDLAKGDVSELEDVKRAFQEATVPVGGIIQGAMVLRDRPFTSMTIKEYHETIKSKVQGTWNLHNVALAQPHPLDFFTMLSSISGVVGQKGQANYAAANVFLDSFATYRQTLGLAANCVDLGAIEDVGYMAVHSDLMVALDTSAWTPINEALFHKIVRFSILQQIAPIDKSTSTQLITSIAVPQQANSKLLIDARFGGLCFGDSAAGGAKGSNDGKDGSKEIQALFLMVKGGMDHQTILDATIGVINRQFMSMLRLSEAMEPGKPLSSYGLDSLAAVEFRNWVRMELGAELTTLDITNAASLIALCEKIVGRIQVAGSA